MSSSLRYRNYRRAIRTRTAEEARKGFRDNAPPQVEKTKSHKRQRTFGALLKSFWGMCRGQESRVIVALALITVSVIVRMASLSAPKPILDYVLGTKPLPAWLAKYPMLHNSHTLLAVICVALIVLAVASALIGNQSRWIATKVTKRLQTSVRTDVFDHAVRLPLHRVYSIKSGGAASLLREDAGGVGELVFSMLYNPWSAIVQLVLSVAVLFWVDWKLLLGAVALLPITWYTHRTWISKIRPLWRDIRNSRQMIDSHAVESFGGMRVVRGFSRQRTESNAFTQNNHFMVRQEIFNWWWNRGIDIAWSLIIPIASAGLLWYGGSRVLSGKLSAGDLMMFLLYLTAMLGPIATLAGSAAGLQNNLAGLDRVLDLLGEPLEPGSDNGRQLERETVRGHIELRNVSFAYGKDKEPVLRDIVLDAKPGQTIALVGPSGAGKTTLCNLIARFYAASGGQILLDGEDVSGVDLDSYRRLLGIVEQDTFLFDGTIAQNIAYGAHTRLSLLEGNSRGEESELRQKIITAARQANAHEFISELENGYDTLIGERGVRLSGGQRQRLTIARAILADPKILILDEATSNLDTHSEMLIQQSLANLMQNRTCFVIAHRLSTIRHADQIVVMQRGEIVERGTHEELLSRSGLYQEMVELQTRPVAIVTPRNDDPVPSPVGMSDGRGF